jgi:hypothetical protein
LGKLVLFLADGTTLDIPLDRERTTIGRRPGTDVCLPYAAVSGEHAIIVTSARGATLEDLGSTNGTLVNGESIARHRLVDGDRIDIGRQKLIYLADPDATVPITPRRRSTDAHGEPPRSATSPASRTELNIAAPRAAALMPLPSGAPAEIAVKRIGAVAIAASPPVRAPTLTVLAGPNAGRTLHLTKPQALIGRVGAQVAVIRRVGDGYRVALAEGAAAPRVNGAEIPDKGRELASGDELEVAGAKLRFATPPG